jgi:CheY-like chemotaxis protein
MPRTLLIVDANTTVQRVTKLAFRGEDVTVNTVQAGRDPIEIIASRPPDIILTDSAAAILAFLKTRADLSHIPVVLLKGAFDRSTGDEESLVDAVLKKPLQPDAMVACVKGLLNKPVAPTPAAAAPVAPVQETREKHEQIDARLDLDEYFDQLSLAFNKAEIAALQPERSTPPPGGGFRYASIPAPAAVDSAASPEPGPRARHPPTAGDVNTELVEQITQRVLNQLNERMVRSTATEIVSRLSRWLIVNEIERHRPPQHDR